MKSTVSSRKNSDFDVFRQLFGLGCADNSVLPGKDSSELHICF